MSALRGAIIVKVQTCEAHVTGDIPEDCRMCKRFPQATPPQLDYYHPNTCHRCGCELPNDAGCIDDAENEYEDHADEPPGAGWSEAETPFADNE